MEFCGEMQSMCMEMKGGKCILDKCKIEKHEKVLKEELLPPPPPEESKWPDPKRRLPNDTLTSKPEESKLKIEPLPKVKSSVDVAEEINKITKALDEAKYRIPGVKYDKNKPRYSLLPWDALDYVAAVMEYGAQKYEENNWQNVDDGYRRYIDAAYRHLAAIMQGEERDPESGLLHIAHAATSLLFALHFKCK